MGKWEMVRLGDVFTSINNGASIKQGDEIGSGIPITRIETISDGTINRKKMGYAGIVNITNYSNYILNSGDILMSHINSTKHLGKTALYKKQDNEAIIHGMNLLRLQVDKSKLNSVFVNYFFNSPFFKQQIPRITKNSVNQSSFTVTALKELVIPLPSLDIQQKIADVLGKASALIELRKAQLDKLDLLIKSQFKEMFGDPVLNQKQFPVYIVDDIIKFQGGSQPDKKFFEYAKTNDNIRLIQIRDYKSNRFNTYIPKAMAKRFCTADDIMIGRYGPPIFQILQGIEGSFNVALMKATPKKGNREFIKYFLKQECLLHYLEGLSQRTAGQDGIQMDMLKAYPFPYPPTKIQNEFAAFVEQVEEQKKLLQQSLSKLELNYKSLMQKCFRGEIF